MRRHPGDHDSDVKRDSEASEADEGARNGGIDGPHVSAESTGGGETWSITRRRSVTAISRAHGICVDGLRNTRSLTRPDSANAG